MDIRALILDASALAVEAATAWSIAVVASASLAYVAISRPPLV